MYLEALMVGVNLLRIMYPWWADPFIIVQCFCGEGNGNPLQYSCLENPMDRGAWQTMAHGVAKESDTI